MKQLGLMMLFILGGFVYAMAQDAQPVKVQLKDEVKCAKTCTAAELEACIKTCTPEQLKNCLAKCEVKVAAKDVELGSQLASYQPSATLVSLQKEVQAKEKSCKPSCCKAKSASASVSARTSKSPEAPKALKKA